MTEYDCHRRLSTALDDIHLLINILALLPWAVRVPQAVPRRNGERIPAQRRETDGVPWSMVHAITQAAPLQIPLQRVASPPTPAGVPTRARIQLPRRVR